ncbi:MAG: VCBS repeat-containing protein [Candidatus Midichloria sp.]|nr:VCBS repeat-containing protein [Candidatus Midichloria sp.]
MEKIRFQYLIGNGDGTLKSAVFYGVVSTPRGVVIADFNRDGKQDIIATNQGSYRVSVLP